MTTQDYSAPKVIEGVERVRPFYHRMEDGEFCEIARLNLDGTVPQLQFNHSIIRPQVIKAFHWHQRQRDGFYPLEPLIIILHDLRPESPTLGVTMKFSLFRELLIIPPGVLHGLKNPNYYDVNLLYGVDQFFDPENTDEHREKWDFLGVEIWDMPKG